jgi:hypothetical protein
MSGCAAVSGLDGYQQGQGDGSTPTGLIVDAATDAFA